jgi:serine/threonine protein kinase
MALAPGTRLGAYEIRAAIGAGGMGEVYRARDTRLDRTVAIKVLPESLAADLQFRERFDWEARAISQLTHPNICTLYDVGHQDSTDYLVMEYLDGQTLADRIAKGPIPLNEALTIAIQIADALDKAHRAGIVHRDVKPGNVMLISNSRPNRTALRPERRNSPSNVRGELSVLPLLATPDFEIWSLRPRCVVRRLDTTRDWGLLRSRQSTPVPQAISSSGSVTKNSTM